MVGSVHILSIHGMKQPSAKKRYERCQNFHIWTNCSFMLMKESRSMVPTLNLIAFSQGQLTEAVGCCSSPHTWWALWCCSAREICSHTSDTWSRARETSDKCRRRPTSKMFFVPVTKRTVKSRRQKQLQADHFAFSNTSISTHKIVRSQGYVI